MVITWRNKNKLNIAKCYYKWGEGSEIRGKMSFIYELVFNFDAYVDMHKIVFPEMPLR